ncbi:MAG: ribosome maturation factor RimP [Pyrinomonadaceae bacterium]
MNKLSSSEEIHKAAVQAAEKYNLELVHVEIVGSERQPIIRIYIDKPASVSHEDCSLVSRFVTEVFDADNLISPDYSLEVSSPGLERELYSLKDFEKFTGSLAKVKTNAAINGQRNFRGRIKNVEGEEIIFDDKTNGEVRFPYQSVAKANLEIDIEEEFKKSGER